MEVAMENEDDLFFADLSKQISLLIMDDDDVDVVVDYDYQHHASRCPSASFQGLSRESYPSSTGQTPYNIYDQLCSRESKGTGVFIPRSSLPRRKQRHGRFSNNNSSKPHNHHHHHRHLENSNSTTTRMVTSHQLSSHNNNSFINTKRAY